MLKCPTCGKQVPSIKQHWKNRPTTCHAIASLTKPPKERREQILREVKKEGLEVVGSHIKEGHHGDPFYHKMVDASYALGNGADLRQMVYALQAIGTALIDGGQGRVAELERLQDEANRIGYELNLSPGVAKGRRRPRKIFSFC